MQVYSSSSNNSVPTEVTAVALSCNEKEIYSGSNRGIINLWDMETAKRIKTLNQLIPSSEVILPRSTALE
jgi:WD40 repeat protein